MLYLERFHISPPYVGTGFNIEVPRDMACALTTTLWASCNCVANENRLLCPSEQSSQMAVFLCAANSPIHLYRLAQALLWVRHL